MPEGIRFITITLFSGTGTGTGSDTSPCIAQSHTHELPIKVNRA